MDPNKAVEQCATDPKWNMLRTEIYTELWPESPSKPNALITLSGSPVISCILQPSAVMVVSAKDIVLERITSTSTAIIEQAKGLSTTMLNTRPYQVQWEPTSAVPLPSQDTYKFKGRGKGKGFGVLPEGFFPNSFSFRVLVVGSKKVPTNFSAAGPGQAWPNPKKEIGKMVS